MTGSELKRNKRAKQLTCNVIFSSNNDFEFAMLARKMFYIHRLTYQKGVHSYRYFLQPMRTLNVDLKH